MCRGTAQVTVGLRRGCNKSQSQGPGRDLTLGNLCLSSNAPACGIPSAPSEGGKQYYANRSHIFIIRDIPREYNENHSADARAYQPPQPRPRVCPGKMEASGGREHRIRRRSPRGRFGNPGRGRAKHRNVSSTPVRKTLASRPSVVVTYQRSAPPVSQQVFPETNRPRPVQIVLNASTSATSTSPSLSKSNAARYASRQEGSGGWGAWSGPARHLANAA